MSVKRYRVKRECFHNSNLYKEGDVVEFPASEAPPHHFEPLDADVEEVAPEAPSKRSRASKDQA